MNSDWNYYVNRLPRFDSTVNNPQHIPLPINSSVTGLATSGISDITGLSNVADTNVNVPSINTSNVTLSSTVASTSGSEVSVKAIPNEQTSSLNTKVENCETSDIDTSKEDKITSAIALKVSSLLSNNSLIQGAISQLQTTASKDLKNEVGKGKSDLTDEKDVQMHPVEFTGETDSGPSTELGQELPAVR